MLLTSKLGAKPRYPNQLPQPVQNSPIAFVDSIYQTTGEPRKRRTTRAPIWRRDVMLGETKRNTLTTDDLVNEWNGNITSTNLM
jgi:hypothetical protein